MFTVKLSDRLDLRWTIHIIQYVLDAIYIYIYIESLVLKFKADKIWIIIFFIFLYCYSAHFGPYFSQLLFKLILSPYICIFFFLDKTRFFNSWYCVESTTDLKN